MYIVSRGWPSLGIEPRMPIVWGWWGVSQMSTVAHSSGDCARGRNGGRAAAVAAGAAEQSVAASSAPTASSGAAVVLGGVIL